MSVTAKGIPSEGGMPQVLLVMFATMPNVLDVLQLFNEHFVAHLWALGPDGEFQCFQTFWMQGWTTGPKLCTPFATEAWSDQLLCWKCLVCQNLYCLMHIVCWQVLIGQIPMDSVQESMQQTWIGEVIQQESMQSWMGEVIPTNGGPCDVVADTSVVWEALGPLVANSSRFLYFLRKLFASSSSFCSRFLL